MYGLITDAVMGLVVGDALGVPVEFMGRGELEKAPVTGMRAYGTHYQSAGTWSDDSSMALCTLNSLTNGLDYTDIMTRFLRWAMAMYLIWVSLHGRLLLDLPIIPLRWSAEAPGSVIMGTVLSCASCP